MTKVIRRKRRALERAKGPTAEEVRSARLARGHTQEQAARAIDSALRTWQAYEAGDRNMPRLKWRTYCAIPRVRPVKNADPQPP